MRLRQTEGERSPQAVAEGKAGTFDSASSWRLVQRVSESQYFARSPKLRKFLLHICENALLGRDEALREQAIGHQVFGRPEDYNTGDDNVVRVEARELRRRLARYFENEGSNEPIRIGVPKGAYVPVFEEHKLETSGPAATVAPAPSEVGTGRGRLRWLTAALAIAVVILVAMVAVLWRQGRPRGAAGNGARLILTAEDRALYDDLFGGFGAEEGTEALLVLSNPRVLLYQGSTDPDADRASKLERGYGPVFTVPEALEGPLRQALNPGDRGLLSHTLTLMDTTYTGMGEAVCAFHVGRLMLAAGRRLRLTQARFLTWDVAQDRDLIVLGAPRTNEWTSVHMPKLNFRFGKRTIKNSEPNSGEPAEYVQTRDTDFGIVSMSTLPGGSRVLTLAGISSESTGAMGELIADPKRMREVRDRIRESAAPGQFPDNWEILARTMRRDNIVVNVEIEAIRTTPKFDN